MKWQQVHLIRLQGSPGMHWESSFTVYFKPGYTVEVNTILVAKGELIGNSIRDYSGIRHNTARDMLKQNLLDPS